MMHFLRQRVLVINSGSVFDTSMVQLLELARDLDVLTVDFNGADGFLAEVARLKPSVIVVNETDRVDAARILEVLRNSPPRERLRVIVIRMKDNTLEQYEIKQVIATESADLVALIRDDRFLRREI
jgi:chemotaxis response regulator CheB